MFLYWDKKTSTENRGNRPLSYPLYFPIPEIFWHSEGFSYEIFRYCGTTNFRRWIVIPPPSHLSIKFSGTRKNLKHQKVPLRIFSALWDKNFSSENCDTPFFEQSIKSSCGFDVCRKLLKTEFKTVVLFLTICKSWSEHF